MSTVRRFSTVQARLNAYAQRDWGAVLRNEKDAELAREVLSRLEDDLAHDVLDFPHLDVMLLVEITRRWLRARDALHTAERKLDELAGPEP
jgi:hypothetical protein